VLLLKDDDVRQVLTMRRTLEALDETQKEIAKGDAATMGRVDVYLPSTPTSFYRWAVMTGGAKRDGFVVARMLSDVVSWSGKIGQQRENKHCIQPGTYCGLLFMFSARDGMPVALINDGYLQHMRVGAGAGLGVKYLSRKDSQIVGMIGSGGMARTYLEAFAEVRNIKRVKIYSPSRQNVETFAQEVREKFKIEVEPVDSARDAVRGVDIVSCCTSSIDPVFKTDWLEPGMHVTDVTWDETEPGFAGREHATPRRPSTECVLCSPWIFKLCRRPARRKGNHSEATRAPGDPSASQPRRCDQRQGEGTDR